MWGEGGKGAEDLAKAVVEVVESGSANFTPMYDWKDTVENKIAAVATKVYGAKNVEYSALAKKNLRVIAKLGLDAIC